MLIEFACSNSKFMNGSKIRCSRTKCNNRKYLPVDNVKLHFMKWGLKPNYYEWNRHHEPFKYLKNEVELEKSNYKISSQ